MTLEYILYICLFISSYSFLRYYYISKKLKHRVRKLNKQLTGHLTDFEKLEFIIKIYNQVDFEKLRGDQINNWNEFLNKIK